MCGRYYIDDETAKEIEKIVRQVSDKYSHKGDVYPTNQVPVVYSKQESLFCDNIIWGFPNFKNKGVIINARSETVKEKRTFSDSVLHRRCIIPATGFYEWDKAKNKVTFRRKDNHILFMGGIWRAYEEEKRFVILTTNANASVSMVHERMPLILEQSELENWIFDDTFTDFAIQKTPVLLDKIQDYEQLALIDRI